MQEKYYVFGASSHGMMVLAVLFENNMAIAAIIDDEPKVRFLVNVPVMATVDFQLDENCYFIMGIGNNAIRKKIVEQNNFSFYNGIHPSAYFSKFATVGTGTVIMPQVVVNPGVRIGNHCILNSSSVVEHDCVLANYVHISPNAALAGNVSVGEGTHVGIGACVIQGVKIGKWATIGAGAVIIKDVPDYAVVVGNPGKIIKYNTG